MKDMISGDIGDNRMHQRAASLAAGAQKLQQLFSFLDRPWFRNRHAVAFELDGTGKGLTLSIVRPGNAGIASWIARGDTLVFTNGSGTELRAELLDCAVSMTREYLEQTRVGRH